MILMKDSKTGKKSLTVTCVVTTLLLTQISIIANIYLMIIGKEPSPSLIWACMGVCTPFVGILWNKRVRADKDGISLESDITCPK